MSERSNVDDEGLGMLADIPDPLAFQEAAAVAPPAPSVASLGASPTRGGARRRRLLAGAAGAAWLVGVAVVLGLRGDLGHGTMRTVVQVALPALGGAVVLATALAAGRGGIGARTGGLVAAFALALTMFPLAALFGSGVLLDPGPGLARGIVTCFALALLIGGVPLAFLALALRSAFAANARWRSTLVAAAAGLFGAASLGAHCSTHCGAHMVLGHAVPAVLLAFLGGMFLSRVARA